PPPPPTQDDSSNHGTTDHRLGHLFSWLTTTRMGSVYQPPDVGRLFKDLEAWWAVAGGWAIDCFIGSESRTHADLDIAVLRRDVHQICEHLIGWDLHVVASPGRLQEWDGSILDNSHNQLWCRSSPTAPWAFELLFNDSKGGDWLFRRNHNIRKPLDAITGRTSQNIPYLIPEIVLLFKAKIASPIDEADLHSCIRFLSDSGRAWLREAIELTHGAEHPWIGSLS
ncbi:MAG: hypothetical protein WD313_02230, partial [Acidimicrobiia bacterium]